MKLVAIDIDTIRLGHPLPFVLRGANGVLLANKGYVIRDRDDLSSLLARGAELCVDTEESGDSYRTYLAQMQHMLLAQAPLGQIASMKLPVGQDSGRSSDGASDWLALQARATQLLRVPDSDDFPQRLLNLHERLQWHCEQAPDAALLALIYLTGQETRMYSATHAMLVACVCMLVARETLGWKPRQVARLGQAALSMNVAMTMLQDQLALQTDPLTAAQINAIQDHALHSEALLQRMGMADPVWLEAVRHHHSRTPGPLADRSEGMQMARLIQRADLFGARIAPRATRAPMVATAAMQASYYDEQRQVDEAGAALVKTLGVYPPGTFVRLATQEVALVLRRGASAAAPGVAVVLNREGMPTGELIRRDTAQPQWKVSAAVARQEVRLQLPLERLLPLV